MQKQLCMQKKCIRCHLSVTCHVVQFNMSESFLLAMEQRTVDARSIAVSATGALFDRLPDDILDKLVPKLLVGRSKGSWIPKTHRVYARRPPRGPARYHNDIIWIPDWKQPQFRESSCWPHLLEGAILPTMRVALVCKRMRDAVRVHMTKLCHPPMECATAASTIQRAWWSYYEQALAEEGEGEEEVEEEEEDYYYDPEEEESWHEYCTYLDHYGGGDSD